MGRRAVAACLVMLTSAVTFGMVSCGSGDDSSGGTTGDAATSDGTATDGKVTKGDAGGEAGVCGPAVCAAFAGACGTIIDACGDPIACGLCQFTGEVAVPGFSTSNFPVSLALGPDFDVAYPGGLSVRGAGAWTANAGPTSPYLIDLAVASDGTAWILYIDASNHVQVAHGQPNVDAGAYTVEEVTTRPGYGAAIAIGSDGVPVVAYAGYNSALTAGAVSIWRRDGGVWTETPVATGSSASPFQSVAFAMHGTDENVLFLDPAGGGTLSLAHGTGAGAFTVDPVSAGVGTLRFDVIGVAVDSSGAPHVAFAGSYADKSTGAWKIEPVPAPNFFVGLDTAEPIRIAVSPSGTIAYGALQGGFTWIATRTGTTWASQAVVRRCTFTQSFDMAFNSASELAITHTCGPDRVDFILQTGAYPASYSTTCAQAGAAACAKAGTCPLNAQSKPCINGSSGGSTCIDTGYCDDYITVGLCGDATQDAATMTDCLAAIPSALCEAPDASDPGLIMPTACPPAE